jgi:hypothetical protein
MIWAVGGLAALLLVLLLTPVRLELALGNQPGFVRTARLTWAWGLFAADLAKQPAASGGPAAQAKGRKRTSRARRLRLPTSAMILDAITPVRTLLRRLVRATHPRGVCVQAQLGLEDPAETGLLWGLLGPAVALLEGTTDHVIEVEPIFAGAELQWAARGRFTLVPAQLVAVVLGFGLSPAVVRFALHMSRSDR